MVKRAKIANPPNCTQVFRSTAKYADEYAIRLKKLTSAVMIMVLLTIAQVFTIIHRDFDYLYPSFMSDFSAITLIITHFAVYGF